MSPSDNQSSKLIVDFPYDQQVGSKSVRFSSRCSGRYMKYPSQEEIIKRWYSSEDQGSFKQNAIQDAINVSLMIRSGSSEIAPADLFIDCIGLSHLVSRNVFKRWKSIDAARKYHVRVVLEEQKQQIANGIHSPESLARVSKTSSELAKRKAYKIAEMAVSV